MSYLIKYFLRGLAVVVPIVLTIYVVVIVFTRIDRLVEWPFPGMGFGITLLSIIAIGVLTSNIVGRSVVGVMDRIFVRAPLVKIVYSSIKDLVEAFVGDKRRFNRPVMVSMDPEGAIKAVGFVTRDELDTLSLPGHAAVYLPHSYNFSGYLLLVPRERITALPGEGSQWMPFVVSGGVSGDVAL